MTKEEPSEFVRLTLGFQESHQLWREGKKPLALLALLAETSPYIVLVLSWPIFFPIALTKYMYESAAQDRRHNAPN